MYPGLFRYYTKLGAFWAETCAISEKSSWHEVMSNIFATNALGPLHWTLNSCFGEFRIVLGAFGTVSLLCETRCNLGRTGVINEKVRATKSCETFFQRTLLVQPIGQ